MTTIQPTTSSMRPFRHIVNPILYFVQKERGGIWKTNAIGSQPEVFISNPTAHCPWLVVGNEVLTVSHELDNANGVYELQHSPNWIVSDVEHTFTRLNRIYDHHLFRLVFYGGFPLKFDVTYYLSGLSETVISPFLPEGVPLGFARNCLQPIIVRTNPIRGMGEVLSALRSTNTLALLRNVSGVVGANIDDCLALLV